MNVEKQTRDWKLTVVLTALVVGATSSDVVRGVDWFGGVSQESQELQEPQNSPDALQDLQGPQDFQNSQDLQKTQSARKSQDLGESEVVSDANAPLYAEGEDEALNSFQRGMITVQEFAASTFRLADESTRVPFPSTGLIAEAEWLNWRVASTNTVYSTAYQASGTFLSGDRFELSPKGNGVRTRLGKRFDDCWDLSFCYTYFDGSDSGAQTNGTDVSTTSSVVSTATLISDLAASTPGGTPERISASGNVDIDLNVFDLEFGRWICSESALEYRPFGGLRAGKTCESYSGLFDGDGRNRIRLDQSTKGTGYGLRAGGEANWNVAHRWSVFGSGAVSVLATTLKSRTVESREESGSGVVSVDYRSSSRVATPVLDVRAGVAWRKGGWEVKGGYELSDWFNASQLDAPGSDLLFYGYFAGASWNF